jgi:hypothetical protein
MSATSLDMSSEVSGLTQQVTFAPGETIVYLFPIASARVSEPVEVALSPGTATIHPTQTSQLKASVANSSDNKVTWSINASVGTINSTGFYTPPPSITSKQVVTIIATSAADPNKSATALLTLSPAVSVSVTPSVVNVPSVPLGTMKQACGYTDCAIPTKLVSRLATHLRCRSTLRPQPYWEGGLLRRRRRRIEYFGHERGSAAEYRCSRIEYGEIPV